MRTLVACALLVPVAGCGGCDDPATTPDARLGEPPVVARFDPPLPGAGGAWGIMPYPSDLYLDADGRLALSTVPAGPLADAGAVAMLRDGLATLTGAGLRSNVYLPIAARGGATVDPDTLAGAAALLDLDTGDELAADVVWRDDLAAIVIAPALGTVLAPDRRYAAYLTADAQDDAGGAIAADPEFLAAIDLTTTPADAAVAAAQDSLRPLVEALPPATRDRLVAATVFRTATFPAQTRRMRDVVAALPPVVDVLDVIGDAPGELEAVLGVQDADAIPGTCADNTRPQPHSHVARLVHGTIGLTSFLSELVNVAGFPEYDVNGTPIVKGTHVVRFTLMLPAVASWEDLPVLLYVHGLGRTRADFLTQIDTAARRGAAMLAIDLPYHGHRANRDPALHDLRNELLGTDLPDGFGDPYGLFPATALFHLSGSGGIPPGHPRAVGENLRQAAIELTQLVALVRDGSTSPLAAAVGAPVSFRDQVGLITESLGAMIAGVALAVEPDLTVAYVSSPAAGLPEPAMLHSPNYAALFAGAITGAYDIADQIDVADPARDTRIHPLVMLHGNVIERGDAIAYAPLVTRGALRGGAGPDLVVSIAWGDVWVSNDGSEAYAKALGLPLANLASPERPDEPVRFVELDVAPWPVTGNLPGGRSGCLVVFHPAGHAALRKYEEHRNHDPVFPPYVSIEPPERIFPTQAAEIHELWGELVADHFDGDGAVSITDPYADSDPSIAGTPCP
jgi:hypothetical protein